MGGLEIIMLVCLSASPASCEERHIDVGGDSVAACIAWAEPTMAQWASSHPKYTISRWRCTTAGAEGQKT